MVGRLTSVSSMASSPMPHETPSAIEASRFARKSEASISCISSRILDFLMLFKSRSFNTSNTISCNNNKAHVWTHDNDLDINRYSDNNNILPRSTYGDACFAVKHPQIQIKRITRQNPFILTFFNLKRIALEVQRLMPTFLREDLHFWIYQIGRGLIIRDGV